MKTVTIELTELEADDFKLFQKNIDNFKILLITGVFDQKSATVCLNFDHEGILQNVKRADMLFNRKFGTMQ